MEQTVHIKNMVCPRCKMAVQTILEELKISFSSIELGEVKITDALTSNKKEELADKLKGVGFELLESEDLVLITQIKSVIVQQIHYSLDEMKVNFSDFLVEKIKHNYNYISRLFSEIEGITIEKFISLQKVERIKELLFNNEKTLSEIAFEMDYSSSAYLSTQFKKETGMTPSAFKKMKQSNRSNLDTI
ncbi:MAG: helix-turn-helix transcriptional regulator [Flavobacteriales bacterium]|nr:helix-turn-helix transcriptional regulator [Flavobacteriales bacterium]